MSTPFEVVIKVTQNAGYLTCMHKHDSIASERRGVENACARDLPVEHCGMCRARIKITVLIQLGQLTRNQHVETTINKQTGANMH